jgi:putative hydrolase of the HAD superfamily
MNDLCVVFDIDDTLYLEYDYVVSGFTAVGEWARNWIGIDGFAERCRAIHDSGRRGSVFNTALSEYGVEPKPELISALVGIYRAHAPDITLCFDADTAMQKIAARWPVAVISDGPAISQSRKAEALRLSRFASCIVLTELLGQGCSKPSPAAFEMVQRRVESMRYVYIADNPLKDFTAPLKLGWTAVRVRRTGGLHSTVENSAAQPHFDLQDCTGLEKLLENLI